MQSSKARTERRLNAANRPDLPMGDLRASQALTSIPKSADVAAQSVSRDERRRYAKLSCAADADLSAR